MQKPHINEYDNTKKMLNTLRSFNESRKTFKTLNEQVDDQEPQQQQQSDITVINDVDVKFLSTDSADLKVQDEQKNMISTIIDSFREQVSQIGNLEPGFTMSDGQIRLDGNIPNEDINFVFISGEKSGIYVNANMLKLEENTVLLLDKLFKFELTFNDAMNPLIRQRENN
jgi:hypothetical protein